MLFNTKQRGGSFGQIRQMFRQVTLAAKVELLLLFKANGFEQTPPEEATRDHYIAASRGGTKIVAACSRCNNLKADYGAERFTRIIRELLKNPAIDQM